jgi:hypothetical protein
MNTRERSVRTARRKLSDEQLTAFLRAIRDSASLLAVTLINESLDAGEGLDGIFYDGDERGFSLSVTRVSRTVFRIQFGCLAGPLAGDGGEWDVAFDPQGGVVSVDPGSCWTC